MTSLYRFAPLAAAMLLGACTYGIKLDSGGEHVRTAWNGGVSGCRDVGKVTVSVLSRVGPVDRNDIKVRDELEIMARNQAADMRADTIVPLGEPRDGEQSWEGYACGNAGPAPSATVSSRSDGAPVEDIPGNAPQPFSAPAPASSSAAETFPVSGGSH